MCELCAPRAAHEGWLRESDGQSLTLPPMRPRRGRSLFERLPVPVQAAPGRQAAGRDPRGPAGSAGEPEAEPYDLFADAPLADRPAPRRARAARSRSPRRLTGCARQPAGRRFRRSAEDPAAAPEPAVHVRSETHVPLEEPSEYVREAIAVFNASEFPRRVAGVARSLGEPMVTVRSAEHLSSVVSIVVAWELCWYRYEVDLSEPVVEAQVIAQGTELAEPAREDRTNAAAGESGTLALPGVWRPRVTIPYAPLAHSRTGRRRYRRSTSVGPCHLSGNGRIAFVTTRSPVTSRLSSPFCVTMTEPLASTKVVRSIF